MKNIFKIIILLALVFAVVYILGGLGGPSEKDELVNGADNSDFAEVGYISNRDESKVNEALFLVYEEPGAPALDVLLKFDDESMCRYGEDAMRCIEINQTITGFVNGRRVFVEGKMLDDKLTETVLVKNLAIDIEANRKFGFIRSLKENGANYLAEIDEVEFLYGDEAVSAGVEDTNCTRENIYDCIPSMNNDFYIRNLSTSTETLIVTDGTKISIFSNPGSPVLVEASPKEFFAKYNDPRELMKSYTFKYVLNGAEIVSLEEQYTP